MHKSYDPLAREHHTDRFNIDFIRYFTQHNLLGNLLGATAGTMIFFLSGLMDFLMNRTALVLDIYLIGALTIFVFLATAAHEAGHKIGASLRMAGRRGLYSYVFLTFVALIGIWLSGTLSLQDPFQELFWMIMSCQIVAAVFAVPLDFLATFTKVK